MTQHSLRVVLATLTLAAGVAWPAAVDAQTVKSRYETALKRDTDLRTRLGAASSGMQSAERTRMLSEARSVIGAYEAIVQRYRASGYADNSLYNAAALAELLHARFTLTTDLDSALRLHKRLMTEYPHAPLARQSATAVSRLSAAAPTIRTAPIVDVAPTTPGRATLTAIDRVVLPELVRVTLSLDREVPITETTLSGPARVFFDLKRVDATATLHDAVLRYSSDVVRLIRVGRHPDVTRVVLDLEGVGRHSVYPLYNPFRVVIDAEPISGTTSVRALPPHSGPGAVPAVPVAVPVLAMPAPPVVLDDERPLVPSVVREPIPTPPVVPAPAPPAASGPGPVSPTAPTVNAAGGFSIARQLGLGVSRIVIDPGHGGHDPGALGRGLSEADLTLDIALRLEKLLQSEVGLDVVLTRRTDVYVPLEARTAIANREGADLFLSIHANTSPATSARGVETYFLNFAGSPEAEAVAARENASHAGEMRRLPDLVKAIALNNKLDESRDLAGMVQEALVSRLRRSNKSLVNRGVKKAPFVVLIGAEMPSVLAEVSFLTNKQELQLLKSAAYKQRIAEALHAAVMRYRRSLKGAATVAAQTGARN